MSIIIVGIGDSNFEIMKELDGDNGLMDDENKIAERDVV